MDTVTGNSVDYVDIEKLAQNLIDIEEDSLKKKPTKLKKKKPVCEFEGCSKHIKCTVPVKCKCGKLFCVSHKLFTNHDCKYDYQGMHRKDLEKNMPKVEFEKIQHITINKDIDKDVERKKKLRTIDPKKFIGDFTF